MRREELSGLLRQDYGGQRTCGVARVPNEGYENILFVVPPDPPTEIPPGLPAGVMGKAISLLERRPNWQSASDLDRLATLLFARREAVSSSRMEGTWSTIDNVLTPSGLYDLDEGKTQNASVRGYAAALELGFKEVAERGTAALTVQLIEKLHEIILSKDPDFRGIPGRIRAPGLPGDVVQIGGGGRKEDSIYNPCPPSHVARCLDGVLAWYRNEALIELGDAGMGLTLPVRMAIGHSHFEAVHPFPNGNGRIGRLLWPLQMAAAGHLPLYLSGYVERHRDAYGKALQEAQKRLSYGPIVAFICDAIIASHDEEKVSKNVIGGLPRQWRARGAFRKGSAADNALDLLIGSPIITAKLLAEMLGVSVVAASAAVKSLERQGVISERTGFKKNRVFAAEEVINVLARPFGEDPAIALEGAQAALAANKG